MKNKLNELLLEIKKNNENKTYIYIEISKIYISMHNYDEALKYLVIALDQDNCDKKEFVFFEMGKIYFMKNDFNKSIKYLECSLKIIDNTSPIYVHVCFFLIKAYKEIKKYEKSAHIMYMLKNNHIFNDEEKELYKHELDEYERYPGSYEFGEDCIELLNIYLAVLRGNPNDMKVLCYLAQMYNYLGLYDETIKLYNNNNDKVKNNEFFNNKFLNEYEIATKSTMLNSKPRNLMVVLSNKCNLSCIMCRAIQNTWSMPKNRLDEIKSLFPYLERVLWQGGEVLLLPYFKELLKESLKYPNIKQAILTNFQLADEEIIELIIKNNIELRISIDGVSKEMYEKIRRGGSFQRLLDNINLLNKLRAKTNTQMSLNLSVVVMRENYNKLIDFIEFANKYKFNFITFNRIEYDVYEHSPEKEKKFALEQDIFTYHTDEEFKCLEYQVKLASEKAKEYGIEIEFRFDTLELLEKNIGKFNWIRKNFYKYNISKDYLLNMQKSLLCHLPWNTLTFYYDGSVKIDCLCNQNKTIGHLKDFTIKELWNNDRIQVYRKNISSGNIYNWCNSNCIKGRVVDSYLKLL